MKKRVYADCPDRRGVRMRLVGESADGEASLAVAVERSYHCPGVPRYWECLLAFVRMGD